MPAGLRLRTQAGREALRRAELSPAGRELVALGLRMVDALDLELAPLDRELRAFARRQPGCRALIERLYGVGPVSAARAGSPDRGYYLQVAERIDHNRACLSVARKLCRRAYHTLRELGKEALAPIEQAAADEEASAAAA